MAKLTNKDKQAIRQGLYSQIDNLLFAASDPSSGYDELYNLVSTDKRNMCSEVADYCYKIIGLYPR